MAKWHEVFGAMSREINKVAHYETNRGGCCVVAALVGRVLEQHGISTRVVVHGRENIDSIREKCGGTIGVNWWNVYGFFAHGEVVFVKDGKEWIYDTDNDVRPFENYQRTRVMDGTLTVDEAHTLAFKSPEWAWNSRFDRAVIPKIEELVNNYLTEVV